MRPFPVNGRFNLLAIGLFLSLLASSAAVAAPSTISSGCLPASIKSTLNAIRSKFGPITIVSTFRRGARIAGSGHMSLHASCRAVDFHPPKGKYSAVLAYLQRTHSGGLGTYSCGMHHLHIDNGPKVRFHHCVGSSGRIAKSMRKGKRSKAYASLKKGKAQAFLAQGQIKKTRTARKKASVQASAVVAPYETASFTAMSYQKIAKKK
jgi:hypothetical protein